MLLETYRTSISGFAYEKILRGNKISMEQIGVQKGRDHKPMLFPARDLVTFASRAGFTDALSHERFEESIDELGVISS